MKAISPSCKTIGVAKGRARLAIGQGLIVWVLEAPEGFGDAGFHAHHAIQITACLLGEVTLADAQTAISSPMIAVAADHSHRIEGCGLFAFVFVEPEGRLGRALHQSLFGSGGLAALGGHFVADHLEQLGSTFEAAYDNQKLLDLGQSIAQKLASVAEAPLPDPRIQRIIDYASSHLEEPLSLNEAAQGVYLSPSRLRHLFVEQTGLPFKTYFLWLRLVRAVQLYSEGVSLTAAAQEAGFSDSAHFSRVFRRTFGLPATTLTRI